MPGPKRVFATDLYQAHRNLRAEAGETNDCAVRAIAAATGRPYREVLQVSYEVGRRPRSGTYHEEELEMLERLGYVAVRRRIRHGEDAIMHRYPIGYQRALRGITTYHPARFPRIWRDGRSYLFFVARHVAACVDGEVHDWAAGRAKQVREVWEVMTPAEAEAAGETPLRLTDEDRQRVRRRRARER